jgi:hypothetical protein
VISQMSITLELDLPEELASEAASTGLLESGSISTLLMEEIRRRKSAAELKSILSGIRLLPGEPMSDSDIQSEINLLRAKRCESESRC